MNDKQPPTLAAQTRAQIANTLPHAIEKALASYHEFYDQMTPDNAKDFSAHHGACKTAIAHIELLLKLAKWADLPQDGQQELKSVLDNAQNEIQTTNLQYSDDDDA